MMASADEAVIRMGLRNNMDFSRNPGMAHVLHCNSICGATVSAAMEREFKAVYDYLSGCTDEELETVRGYLEEMEREAEGERRKACVKVMEIIDNVLDERSNQ